MSEPIFVVAQELPPDQVIYEPVAGEVEPNHERMEELMARRNAFLERISESDKMHNAMVSYQKECSEKTREGVRQRRRQREIEERRKEGLERSRETRRKVAEPSAEQKYEQDLKDKFDEPKSKIRRAKAKVSEGGVKVEGNGQPSKEADGHQEA